MEASCAIETSTNSPGFPPQLCFILTFICPESPNRSKPFIKYSANPLFLYTFFLHCYKHEALTPPKVVCSLGKGLSYEGKKKYLPFGSFLLRFELFSWVIYS